MTHYLPLLAALILPWLPSYRRPYTLILTALCCYALLLFGVYLYDISLKNQLAALSGGKEFFPPTPETDALLSNISRDTARRLAPFTAWLPAILYPLTAYYCKRGIRRRKPA